MKKLIRTCSKTHANRFGESVLDVLIPLFLPEAKMEIVSMSEAIRFVIDGMPDGTCFFGNELKNRVVRVYPEARHTYIASVLHCMRRCRGDVVECINRNDSLYRIRRKSA